MGETRISPDLFTLFARIIEEATGIHYALEQQELLATKLEARAEEAGFDRLLDYYYFLRYDPGGPAELIELIESLVVPETYFFRELDALRVIVSEVIAPLADRRSRPRVWCAASSTGEEPLTLAMLLAGARLLERVELVASDLSERALARARAGGFGLRSLRREIPDDLRRWVAVSADRVIVDERVRAAVSWRRVNLIDRDAVAALGTFDAILCRNVLIYFRDATARRVLASLTDALRPRGVLVVGASESLLRLGTSLSWEERGGVFLYRKAG